MLPLAAGMTLFVYGMFDRLLSIPWPSTLIGGWFPVVERLGIPSV